MNRFFYISRREIQKVVSHAVSFVGILAFALPVYAERFTNPLGNVTLYDFLLYILNSVIYILFPIIVLMIVYTGFLFVQAQGNPKKLQEARRALLWTVIGALVVLGSKALALAIEATVDNITVT